VIKHGTGCDFAHKNGCAGDSRGKRAKTHETIKTVPNVVPNHQYVATERQSLRVRSIAMD
jgi:hypothetical protein